MPLIEGGYAPTGDGAAETGGIGRQVRLAVAAARLMHGFSGDLVRVFELNVLHVAGRHGANFIDHVHQHLGTVLGQALSGDGVFGQNPFTRFDGHQETGRVLDVAHPSGAAAYQRFQILGRHHCADTGAAGCAVQIIDDASVEVALLGGSPNAGDANEGVLVLLVQVRVGLPDGFAPQFIGCQQLGFFVFQIEIHRRNGSAFEDDHVPSGHLDFATDETTGI